jgi:superfamily II DNA or RNA helicase
MPIPTKLILPPLVHTENIAIGEMLYVLRRAGTCDVTASSEIKVSARRTETLLSLSNEENVIVSSKRYAALPPEVHGQLREKGAGGLEWVWHRKLDEVAEKISRDGWAELVREVDASWLDAVRFKAETGTGAHYRPGLRPPQLGALHAIGAHWSLQKQPATIVMPTGTGKTETMIAASVAFRNAAVLVVVPSRALRDQTVRKFSTLGLLRKLTVLPEVVLNPVVGVIRRRPTSADELAFLKQCHVVVGTMSALAQGEASELAPIVAKEVGALFVDEAHHIPAESWAAYREHFKERPVLQFTATPFRRDGKLVDGRVIYNYPLRSAQQDGYFKPIAFQPVFEVDLEEGDRAIAAAAVAQLEKDRVGGKDHRIMARCDSIHRAKQMHALYQELAPEHEPLLVHSELPDTAAAIEAVRSGKSKIVVCVDMLGEGFDLPELKIAALHDTHKSLGVLLQFTGRFTRSAGDAIGDATVVANIAIPNVSAALERLYSEDADWNHLLSEFSSDAIKEHLELVEFLRESKVLGEEKADDGSQEISHHLLRPKFSTVAFRADKFVPKRFHEAIGPDTVVHRAWLHETKNTLYFVTRRDPGLAWTRSQDLVDRQWDLFVLSYDRIRKLLYVHSSDKSSTHEALAKAVTDGSAQLVYGDTVFRTLGRINRLQFQSIGVKKHGRRNLRYAMYTGADVAQALGLAETAGSEKSNLFGGGWENGEPVTIGCSYKGRVWSREQGSVPELVAWSVAVGAKLADDAIDTRDILKNVLIPAEVERFPESPALAIEWPIEMLHQTEERVVLRWGEQELPISMFSIVLEPHGGNANRVEFTVKSEEVTSRFALELGGDRGFQVTQVDGPLLALKVGRVEGALSGYLSDYPPLVRFVDMSELDGNLLIKPREGQLPTFPHERFDVWDWTDVDLTTESTWKAGVERPRSIQARAARAYSEGGFDVIFDDDSAGEAADLVCMKDEPDHIRLALVHCKFTTSAEPGERVKDVVEVASQAVRSSKWKWRFRELCRHIATREKRLQKAYRASRFLTGSAKDLNRFSAMSRFKPIRAEIVIVQPGVSRDNCTPEQSAVLAAAHSFLKQTIDTDLDVVCSE